jgi:hypothetical protein
MTRSSGQKARGSPRARGGLGLKEGIVFMGTSIDVVNSRRGELIVQQGPNLRNVRAVAGAIVAV